MASSRQTFRLNVSWDAAILAVERAVRDGRRSFTVRRRDNGYLRLRGGRGISISIQFRIESTRSTMVTMVARQDWHSMPIGRASRLDRALTELREEIEGQLANMSARPTLQVASTAGSTGEDQSRTHLQMASSRQSPAESG